MGAKTLAFLLSIVAGAIGANFAAGIWERYALTGTFNTSIGFIAGTCMWTLSQGMPFFQPTMPGLMATLLMGGICGCMFSLALGSLRRILEAEDIT